MAAQFTYRTISNPSLYIFLGTGHNESKLFLLLRYFLGVTAFYLVIFDFTPSPLILPRYLEKVRCEPEGQFDIFHSKRGRDITMYWKYYGIPVVHSVMRVAMHAYAAHAVTPKKKDSQITPTPKGMGLSTPRSGS